LPSLLVQARHDPVVHVGRRALVHDLGHALRIEILGDVAHNPQQLALPRVQPRGGLLEEIEDVLLRETEQNPSPVGTQLRLRLARTGWHRTPQIVEGAFLVLAPLLLALLLCA
jgi:hypothetical protein